MNNSSLSFIQHLDSISHIIQKEKRSQIQKIVSTPLHICLAIRFSGKTSYLLIGRGGNVHGVWMSERWPKPEFRVKDKFLEVFRSKFINWHLKSISYCSDKNAIILEVAKGDLISGIVLQYKVSGTYVLTFQEDSKTQYFKVHRLWLSEKATSVRLNSKNEITTFLPSVEDKDKFLLGRWMDKTQDFLDKKYLLKKIKIKKVKRSLNRKITNINSELDKIRNSEKIYEKLITGNISLDSDIFRSDNLKVKFKRSSTFYQKRDFLFQKLKNIISRKSFHLKRLEKEKCAFELLDNNGDSELVATIRPVWPSRNKSNVLNENSTKNHKFKEYFYKKYKIAVGLNKEANNYLRANWASKEDWWFHIDNSTSGHIFVKNLNNPMEDLDLINLLGSILRDSQANIGDHIDLVFTQVKNLKAIKGSVGSVIFKNEKRMTAFYQKDWTEIISHCV